MLEVKHLTAGYDGKPVASIKSLILEKGKHCLILGKSGSGKTTLLYALAGLLTPLSGTVQWEGKALTRSDIGIIYQTLHMVKALSVLDNLLLVNYASGTPQDKSKACALLAQLGLEGMAHRSPSSLSQGQQQRVAIARAAMNNPLLIVGDEPTSALDDDSCKVVMKLLLDTAERLNAPLIVATHDARIKSYFDKAIILGDAA